MKAAILFMSFLACLVIFGQISNAASTTTLEELPDITLLVPDNKDHAQYLGLTGEPGTPFKLSMIDTDILVIELFSMYCPYCQKAAPAVNELYESMGKYEDLQLKIIGIGANNTELEVNTFREGFDIRFPLFSDKDMSIYKTLAGAGTPTFIACKRGGEGVNTIFFRKSGGFKDAEEFLNTVLEHSQLKK